jgi:hypothetical protein
LYSQSSKEKAPMETLGHRLIKEEIIAKPRYIWHWKGQHHGGRLGENLIALGFITEKMWNPC